MKSKYIVVEKNGLYLPIVFSELMSHSDIARAIGGKVLGAGFCYVNYVFTYTCYGKSTSLGINSREGIDSDILTEMLIDD